MVGYFQRDGSEFVQVESWDGTRTLVPLADVVQQIREMG